MMTAEYRPGSALIVVDVQNDFADPAGALYVPGGDDVVAAVNDEIAAAMSGSQVGRKPIPGSWRRKWMCITAAPASNACFAEAAISSGVTGTGWVAGLVSTPVSEQVTMALSELMR